MKDYNSIINKANSSLTKVSDMLKDVQFDKQLKIKKDRNISKVGEFIGANFELSKLQKNEYKKITNNKKIKEMFDIPSYRDVYDNNQNFTLKGTDATFSIDDLNTFIMLDQITGGKSDFIKMFPNIEIEE